MSLLPRKSTSSTRFWKWRSRSNKSTSELDNREISYASPMSSLSAVRVSPVISSSSPYLSESAHVLSLQQPASDSATRRTSREPQVSPATTSMQAEGGVDSSGCKHDRQASTSEHAPGFGKSLYQKVIKELEAKLKPKRRKSVRILHCFVQTSY